MEKHRPGVHQKIKRLSERAKGVFRKLKSETAKRFAQNRLDGRLQKAADKGKIEEIRRLLKAGANIDAINASGWTALIRAASKGRTSVCAFLIAEGADISIISYANWDAEGWARVYKYEKTEHFLVAIRLLNGIIGTRTPIPFIRHFNECVQ